MSLRVWSRCTRWFRTGNEMRTGTDQLYFTLFSHYDDYDGICWTKKLWLIL